MIDEEFLKTHGQALSQILQHPSFSAGMIQLSIQALEEIRKLTDEQIENNSRVILATLRGRLKHEHDLIGLSVPSPQEPPDLDAPEYVNQIEEHAQELERQTKPRKK